MPFLTSPARIGSVAEAPAPPDWNSSALDMSEVDLSILEKGMILESRSLFTLVDSAVSMRFLVVSVLLLACVAPASANCPNHCSGRGDCNSADLRCKCHQSIEQQDVWYAGGDCSLRTSGYPSPVRRRVVGGCGYAAPGEMDWGGRADAASSGRAHDSGVKLWWRSCALCCFVICSSVGLSPPPCAGYPSLTVAWLTQAHAIRCRPST